MEEERKKNVENPRKNSPTSVVVQGVEEHVVPPNQVKSRLTYSGEIEVGNESNDSAALSEAVSKSKVEAEVEENVGLAHQVKSSHTNIGEIEIGSESVASPEAAAKSKVETEVEENGGSAHQEESSLLDNGETEIGSEIVASAEAAVKSKVENKVEENSGLAHQEESNLSDGGETERGNDCVVLPEAEVKSKVETEVEENVGPPHQEKSNLTDGGETKTGNDFVALPEAKAIAKAQVETQVEENVGLDHQQKSSFSDGSETMVKNDSLASPKAKSENKACKTQFKQVSLKDPEKRETSSGEIDGFSESLPKQVTTDSNSSSGGHMHHPVRQYGHGMKQSASATSLGFCGDAQSSSIGSPKAAWSKGVTTDVSPELSCLVDSALMGKLENLDKLKNMVSGVESYEQNVEKIAFSVVDLLCATMRGLERFEDNEEKNPSSVMINSQAAILAGELLPSLPWVGDNIEFMSPRTRMVRGLLEILQACTRNRAICSMAGLLLVLLRSAEKIFVEEVHSKERVTWDGTSLCYCIQCLAGHSATVADLQKWLLVIKETLTTRWASLLTLALEKSIEGEESRGPASTFEFDGESSGLLGPGESRWPFTNGYAFATWIYIESFPDTLDTAIAAAEIAAAVATKSGKSLAMSAAAAASALSGESVEHMPRLYSFLTVDNQKVEAYFHDHFLVVETITGNGKKASLHFTKEFKPKCWYFVGLEHTRKQGRKPESEMRLYIDGSLHESHPFDFPRISKPLASCCIGTNPPFAVAGLQRRQHQCHLFAEMGPIYIFRDPIGPKIMGRLAARGGDVLPSFGNAAGLTWLATNDYMQSIADDSALLDTEIEDHIYVLYHPNLLNGRFCQDASPCSVTGMMRRSAEVLGQVPVATRTRVVEALWAFAYGGSMSLLPLVVTDVDKDSLEPRGKLPLTLATASLAAPIFRIITKASQHPRSYEELCRAKGPEVLSTILKYLLQSLSSQEIQNQDGVENEELVAAVVFLCQSQKTNYGFKVKLFRTLLLDLNIWSMCNYGIQKTLLSSLGDMVINESMVMRDADAIEMLLDGCRRCYWEIRMEDSLDTFSLNKETRPVGEVNALIDELLVVIELLIIEAPPSLASRDIRRLLEFLVYSPQPNQVLRVLHLIHKLVVQPNKSRAHTFAEAFIACGGIETLLALLQKEAKAGDYGDVECTTKSDGNLSGHASGLGFAGASKKSSDNYKESIKENELNMHGKSQGQHLDGSASSTVPTSVTIERTKSFSKNPFLQDVGGITFAVSAENARNYVYNADQSDGIIIAIIMLLGALKSSGHLSLASWYPSNVTSSILAVGLQDGGGTTSNDKTALLLFAIQKAFEIAPDKLMTDNVYKALLAVSINASSTHPGMNFHGPGHRFENVELLLVLLRSLPYASRVFQCQALQDLLVLTNSHMANRTKITRLEEWPEWILKILISNYEVTIGVGEESSLASLADIEDHTHNFLISMLEHSIWQKDGWKDVEAVIHCAEWLCIVGGSSIRDQRSRCEKSLLIFKRRLFESLLDIAARELQLQAQVTAAAATGYAAEGLSSQDAEGEAQDSSVLTIVLVENSIVILMLVEDHLRLQSKLFCDSSAAQETGMTCPVASMTNRQSTEATGDHESSKVGELQADVLPAMVDGNRRISASAMECPNAAEVANSYEAISSAFVSYGSCTVDLAEGWKYRSQLWYGVGLPSEADAFGGGGSGWESWKSAMQKDENGNWVELSLVKKSISVVQALLLDESRLGGGLGIGGGSGGRTGGMAALYQLLDSDLPFLCMLRMVLLSLREEDDRMSRNLPLPPSNNKSLNKIAQKPTRKPHSALLWSVLSPVLNTPIYESKRQRVLAASCILYSEVWHAIGKDKKLLRKRYLEAILPPFVAVLRRWRPLLAGVNELATANGVNPLIADDRALATDASPTEAALAMISPCWAASFASPSAVMALSAFAVGASGGENPAVEPKKARLQSLSSMKKHLAGPGKSPHPSRGKEALKAAALAAVRGVERNEKSSSGKSPSAVAMATSGQRRNKSDMERARRWAITEAMGVAWVECLHAVDSKSIYEKDLNKISRKYIAILVACLAVARNLQRSKIDRCAQVDAVTRRHLITGVCAWRKFVYQLIETRCLFGPFGDKLCNPECVFWKLDLMESYSRMRPFLRRNYRGSDHSGVAANFEDKTETKENVMNASNAAALAAEAISTEPANEDDEHRVDDSKDATSDVDCGKENQEKPSVAVEQTLQASAESSGTLLIADQDMVWSSSEFASGYTPNVLNERIILELSSSMVRPLRVVKGTFQVTTRRLNFISDNRKDNTLMEGSDCISGPTNAVKDRSWPLHSLQQMYTRRYLLRRSALELFMIDRSNFFFDFGTSEGRRNAYQAIIQAQPQHLNKIHVTTQKPEEILKKTQLMEQWAKWEISNFDYLMQLNTISGRSYNDITQYPVFPWILSDYSSLSLDLSNPSIYRDLSKPVGALNPERLQQFQKAYSSFDDPVVPKFHYGSHYSSAVIVFYYLFRVEPFTTLSIQLQGRKIDHADRLFSDIGATWNGVLKDISDVKELVPEMFYLPEILMNVNSIDFGTTELGEKIGSVKLPPWAKSPVDFVNKHRMALESEYVSAHLHEWIDLIFGYKQQGKEAISAINVFSYITYEGAIDIDKISDPVQQNAIQNQIAYFGQTPSQLLTVSHMKRMPLADVHLQTIFRNPKEVKEYHVSSPECCNVPAVAIHASSDTVVLVDLNAPAAHIAQHKWQPNMPDGHGEPFLFQHGKPIAASPGISLMRMFKGHAGSGEFRHFPQAQAFAAPGIKSSAVVAITCDKDIITGGHVDNSVKIISLDGAKTLETATGHCAPVTCLSLSSDNNYLVTGSRDTTVILWRIHETYGTRSTSIPEPAGPGTNTPASTPTSTPTSASNRAMTNPLSNKSQRRGIEGPVYVLRGHCSEVTCSSINTDLGIVVSCSDSSDVLLHSIRTGRLIRRLSGVEAQAVLLSSEGTIITWNKSRHTLCTFTLNGIPISSAQLPLSSVSCMEISMDGRSALVGINSHPEHGEDLTSEPHETRDKKLDIAVPSICFIDLHTLEVFHKLELGKDQDITALALNKDKTHLLVSTFDKKLMIFTKFSLQIFGSIEHTFRSKYSVHHSELTLLEAKKIKYKRKNRAIEFCGGVKKIKSREEAEEARPGTKDCPNCYKGKGQCACYEAYGHCEDWTSKPGIKLNPGATVQL